MTGRITGLHPNFGFIADDGGRSHFFHQGDVTDDSGYRFQELRVGDRVTFEAVAPEPVKGPRAANVYAEPPQ